MSRVLRPGVRKGMDRRPLVKGPINRHHLRRVELDMRRRERSLQEQLEDFDPDDPDEPEVPDPGGVVVYDGDDLITLRWEDGDKQVVTEQFAAFPCGLPGGGFFTRVDTGSDTEFRGYSPDRTVKWQNPLSEEPDVDRFEPSSDGTYIIGWSQSDGTVWFIDPTDGSIVAQYKAGEGGVGDEETIGGDAGAAHLSGDRVMIAGRDSNTTGVVSLFDVNGEIDNKHLGGDGASRVTAAVGDGANAGFFYGNTGFVKIDDDLSFVWRRDEDMFGQEDYVFGLAYDPSDDSLWGIATIEGKDGEPDAHELFRIDPNTGDILDTIVLDFSEWDSDGYEWSFVGRFRDADLRKVPGGDLVGSARRSSDEWDNGTGAVVFRAGASGEVRWVAPLSFGQEHTTAPSLIVPDE